MRPAMNKLDEDIGSVIDDQSWEELPQGWYERGFNLYAVYAAFVLASLIAGAVYRFSPPVWLSLIGLATYLASFAFDAVTTTWCLGLKHEFAKRGLDLPAYESNPLLPDFFRWQDQLLNPTVILTGLLIIPLWFMPVLGLAIGALHALAGLNNLRMFRRLRLQVQLYDRATGARRGVTGWRG